MNWLSAENPLITFVTKFYATNKTSTFEWLCFCGFVNENSMHALDATIHSGVPFRDLHAFSDRYASETHSRSDSSFRTDVTSFSFH